MKRTLAVFLLVFSSITSSLGWAVNIINYYKDTVRLEAIDCGTYDSYKAFPSTATWFTGDVANNAKYLYINNVRNGYYVYISGSNMPKKLCLNAYLPESKNGKSGRITARISTYDTCQINVIDNAEGTGIAFNISYDCHAQDLN